MQFEPLEAPDPSLGAQIDSFGPGRFLQDIQDRGLAFRHAKRSYLQREPTVVLIDDQTREAVSFAEDEPAGSAGAAQPQDLRAQPNRRLDSATEELVVE